MEIYIKKGHIEIYEDTILDFRNAIILNSPIRVDYWENSFSIFGNVGVYNIESRVFKEVSTFQNFGKFDINSLNFGKLTKIYDLKTGNNISLPSSISGLFIILKDYLLNSCECEDSGSGGGGVVVAYTMSANPPLSIPVGGIGSVLAPTELAISQSDSATDGYLSSTDWNIFNNKQNAITLTTSGTSGSSSFFGNVLNIPTYTLNGLGGEPIITSGSNLQYWRGDKTWQTLETTIVPEGTNLYFTQSRARQSLSFVAGSGNYDNSTGIITIPTNNNQLTNGSNYITLNEVSVNYPLNYNNVTGNISISLASSLADGYLSSIDWNTFNNKQNALSFGNVTGSEFNFTGATGSVIGSGLTIAIANNAIANNKLVNSFITINGSNISLGGSISNLATTTSGLNQFAITTSAQLASVISDETGTGSLVFSNSPSFVTPYIGSATAENLTITNTTGFGGIVFPQQSANLPTPSTGFILFADTSGRFSWRGSNGFVRSLDATSSTGNRVYTLPNSNGTVLLLGSTINTTSISTTIETTGTSATPLRFVSNGGDIVFDTLTNGANLGTVRWQFNGNNYLRLNSNGVGILSGNLNIGNNGLLTANTTVDGIANSMRFGAGLDINVGLGNNSTNSDAIRYRISSTGSVPMIGFLNTTPIAKITTALSATGTFVANSGTALNTASTYRGYTFSQIIEALIQYGLLA